MGSFLQRTRVWFPTPTWQLATIHSFSSRFSDVLASEDLAKERAVWVRSCLQNKQTDSTGRWKITKHEEFTWSFEYDFTKQEQWKVLITKAKHPGNVRELWMLVIFNARLFVA